MIAQEQLIEEVLKYGGFTPLEILCMMVIGTIVVVFWRFLMHSYKEMITAINNNTSATNNSIQLSQTNIDLVRELRDEIIRKNA